MKGKSKQSRNSWINQGKILKTLQVFSATECIIDFCQKKSFLEVFRIAKVKNNIGLLFFILTDEPTDVSNMTLYKDGFEDILDERRHASDLKYSLKSRQNIPAYKYQNSRSPNEIKQHVLQSDRVKYAMEKVIVLLIIDGDKLLNDSKIC